MGKPMPDYHHENNQPTQSKEVSPFVIKSIIVIAVIWFIVILIFGLIEPNVSLWLYFVVGAPIFALSLLAVYIVGGAYGSMIINWIAEISDREEVKRTILKVIKTAVAFIVGYYLIYLISNCP